MAASEAAFSSGVTVKALEYSPEVIEREFRFHYHPYSHQNIFLFLDFNSTINLFKQVSIDINKLSIFVLVIFVITMGLNKLETIFSPTSK